MKFRFWKHMKKFHLFIVTKSISFQLCNQTTSLESTFHPEVLTFPQRPDQIKSFVVVGVTCHMGDQQCKTSEYNHVIKSIGSWYQHTNTCIGVKLIFFIRKYKFKTILTLRVL